MKITRTRLACIAITAMICITTRAQSVQPLQTSDGEGVTQASYLKKMNKKAKYGVFSQVTNYTFNTGKGINGLPIVTAEEKSTIEMVAMDNNVVMGYLVPYNSFMKIKDYDFEIYYRNSFKSQKYPPEKMALTDESIFLDDNFGQFYGFKATEMGQRSRFKYDYAYEDAKYLTRVFFHDYMPTKQNVVSFKVPDWLELDIMEKNFAGYKIKKDTKKEKGYTTYTYTADNLSAVPHESAALARPYYLPHLIITVRTFTINQKKYNGFKSLDDLYAWYNFLYKKADNKPDEIKAAVQKITQGKTNDEDKIKAIYYWVQDNIRYIAFEEGYAGFVPQTVQEVYKNKFSDCKGMANLVTAMLKEAGYDAHFAWVGTREIPYDRTEVQSLCVDNHAISVLYYKGKPYFIDGTEKYGAFGKNAYRIQGKTVLVEHGDQYKVEKVPEAKPEDNIYATVANLDLKDNHISGHVKIEFSGGAGSMFHYYYNSLPTNKRKDFINSLLQVGNKGAEVTGVKTSDFKNRDIPLVIEGDIDMPDDVTVVDKTCYVNMDFFPGMIARFIPDEERQCPIDMNTVYMSKDQVVLTLPSGAKATELPKNFKNEYNKNNIEATYSTSNNTVTLNKTLTINNPVINRDQFIPWKDFAGKIKDFNKNNVSIQL